MPAASGFSEEITTLILGSRRPVLFVEGTSESLDAAIYRACFPLWTIIPSGSCEQVIHSVMTMRANAALTRIACAGLADADGRSEAEVSHLSQKGIGVLPVSELENLFLMPTVIHAILVSDGHAPCDATEQCNNLHAALFAEASHARNKDAVVVRHVKRRIDAALKRVDLGGAATVMEVDDAFRRANAAIDVTAAAAVVVSAIDEAISAGDAAKLLRWYDNKGVMAIAAKAKGVNVLRFKQWLVRSMANGSVPAMTAAVQALLPQLSPA